MRIWIGPEREGKYTGKLTMFVESSIISKEVTEFIINLLNKSFDNNQVYSGMIEQIYFGAGKVEVEYMMVDVFEEFLDELTASGIVVSLESTKWLSGCTGKFAEILGKYNVHLIHRIEVRAESALLCDVLPNVSYKIETDNQLYFTNFSADATNSIKEVKDGRYEQDQLIFTDYKESAK